MCLDVVNETYDNPSTLIQSGWKSFTGSKTKPQFEVKNLNGNKEVPLDTWLTAEEKREHGYITGFHIYTDETETAVKKLTIRRVYYRNATYLGLQNKGTVIIAKEMYVPSDPDAWPPLQGEEKKPKKSIFAKMTGGNA